MYLDPRLSSLQEAWSCHCWRSLWVVCMGHCRVPEGFMGRSQIFCLSHISARASLCWYGPYKKDVPWHANRKMVVGNTGDYQLDGFKNHLYWCIDNRKRLRRPQGSKELLSSPSSSLPIKHNSQYFEIKLLIQCTWLLAIFQNTFVANLLDKARFFWLIYPLQSSHI